MKAMILNACGPIEQNPLRKSEAPKPEPGPFKILIRISACGICHTDLHVIEGELPQKKLPVIPGHQIVGVVEEAGQKVTRFKKGDRVGIPWLNSACGECSFCKSGKENLCDDIRFTGYHVNGGYAQYAAANENFAYHIPQKFSDIKAAPLLCAGIIGYRSLRLSEIKKGERLGLYGFGASAHIVIQIAVYKGIEVYVFTRSEEHRKLAEKLGAAWTGRAEDTPPALLDSSIIFAPAGKLVIDALRVLQKGGTLALAGIHMSPIPEMDYNLIYHERTIRTIANSTRQDARELLEIAAKIPIETEVKTYKLSEANLALRDLKHSKIQGAGVLEIT
ncbi:MAG: alcohol dehydrogenase [Candidatus Schekmanbacteria bacterium GWA2_38_11]|uniref:alcohol dehydrogenase n=1 Tax=Candidatus Schekmanbacteria bacterium GWA2_38_11 TaxID=1817876 RepID=A0A1F7RLQ5_9BACT|nr:MAG: alcohol dehydrogenase [Candidatus Schekmanbacteria bacterium GWA2_38_11]